MEVMRAVDIAGGLHVRRPRRVGKVAGQTPATAPGCRGWEAPCAAICRSARAVPERRTSMHGVHDENLAGLSHWRPLAVVGARCYFRTGRQGLMALTARIPPWVLCLTSGVPGEHPGGAASRRKG